MLYSHQNQSHRHCSAFTLIEVLVVISIIGILCALLFPVLARAREQGRKTNCTSNLRELHTAIALYAQDYNEYLPPYNNRLGRSSIVNNKAVPWPDQSSQLVACLQSYAHSHALWFCPSDSLAGTASKAGSFDHHFSSYVYHAQMIPEMNQPHLLDSRNGGDITQMPLLSETVWGCKANDLSIEDALYSHNKQYNAVYYDGHVKSFGWQDQACKDAYFTP